MNRVRRRLGYGDLIVVKEAFGRANSVALSAVSQSTTRHVDMAFNFSRERMQTNNLRRFRQSGSAVFRFALFRLIPICKHLSFLGYSVSKFKVSVEMISKSAADRAQVVIGLRGRRDAGVATVRNKRSSAVKLTKKSAEKKESKRWPDAKTTGARESKIVGSDSKRAPAELSLTDAELKLLVEDDLNQFHKFPCTERRIDHTNVLQLLKYHPSARTIDTTELKSLAMSSAVKNESARCGVKDKHAEECLEKKKLSGNQEDDDSSSVVSETSSNSSGTDSDDRDSEARRELVANSRKRVYSFDSPRSAKGGTETLYAAARMSLSPLTLGAALGLEPATPLALPPGIILSRTLSSSKGFINKERKYKDDTESPTQASMSPPVPITIPVETRAGEKHGQPQRHIVLTEAMVEWTLSMIIMRPERFVFDAGKGWKCSGFLLTNDDRICNPLNSLKHRVLPRDREMTVMDWNVIEPDVHWRECALGIPHYFFNLRKLDDSERDLICKLAANSEPRSLAFEIAALAKLGMGYYHGNADAVRRVRKLVHGSRILEQHYKRVGVPKMTEPKLSIGGAGAIAAKNPSVMISRGHDPDAFYEPISTLDMIKKCLWKGRLPGIGDNVQLLYALACGPFWDKDVFAQAAVTGPAATVGIGEGKNATSFRQQGRGHDEVDSKRRESKHMDEELLQSMMVTAVEEDDGDDLLVEQLLQQDMAPESYPGSSDMMTARHGRNVPHRRIVTDRRSSPDRRPRPERQQEADDFWGQSLQGTRSRPRTTLKRRKHALRSANGVVVNKPAGTMMAQIERMDADFNSQATDDLTMLDTDWLALFDLGACKTVVNVADCHERNPDAHVGNLVRLLRGYEPEVVCCVPPLFARQRARAERFDELSFMAQSAFPTENHDDYIKAVTCMTARAVALKWKLDWSSKMKDNLHIVLQSAFWTDYLRSHTAFKTGRELLEEAHVVSPRTIVKNRLAVSWRAADESPVLFGFFVFDWMLGTVAVGGSALGLGGTVPPSKKDVDRTKSISDIVAPDPTSENSGSKISETLVSAVSTSMSVVGTSVETKTKPSGATTALAPSGYRGENSRDLLTDEPIQDFSQYVAYGATNKYWLISFDHLDASLAVETDAKTGLQVVVNPERGLPTKAFEELEKHVLQWIGTKAVAATVSQRKIQISLNGGKWTLDELRMLQGCLLDAGVAHFARRSNLADVIAIMQFKHRYIDSLKPIEKTHCKFVMMRLHDLGWKFRRHQAGKVRSSGLHRVLLYLRDCVVLAGIAGQGRRDPLDQGSRQGLH
jgi:hypothetical protein